MKTKYFLRAELLLSSLQVSAQHPLVGTWDLVSLNGNVDGNNIFLDTATAREIKVITPTHHMVIRHKVKEDSHSSAVAMPPWRHRSF